MSVVSKFAQKSINNGYVARFNSLKNIPIFYSLDLDNAVEDYLNCKLDKEDPPFEIADIISSLKNNRVIIDNNEYDDKILDAVRKTIKKPYPSVLYLILTEKCNFACDYCFIERYMNPKKTNVMSKETSKKAIDLFVRLIRNDMTRFEEEKQIIFYGGEPLSNFETLEYAATIINDYIKKGLLPEKTTMNMVTNGTLLTDEIANRIKELNITFSVSLDGATEKANSCRKFHNGQYGFNKIINGIEIAKRNNCNFGLSMTLSEDALKEKDKIYDLLDKYNINSIGFNILLTDKSYSVPDSYFIEASSFLVEAYKVFRQKGIYEDRMMRKVDAFVNHRLYLQDCAAQGGNQIIIAPNGEIGLCHGYLSTRETFVDKLDNDLFDPTKNEVFIEWNRRSPVNMEQCLSCPALGFCGGGCPLNAKANGESIWDLDKRFCIHAKATQDFLIWDLFENIRKNH